MDRTSYIHCHCRWWILCLKRSEGILMDDKLLIVALVLYIILIIFSRVFNLKFLLGLSVVLWFIPIVEVDNVFIRIISVSMIIATSLLLFNKEETEDF